jgi:multidrug efflux pump subunit AcrA (membrane-fusion protein)
MKAESLRDDLASLRIDRDRRGSGGPDRPAPLNRRPGGDGGIRFVSALIWLIPLGLLGGAGAFAYRQYDQIRAKPEVAVGLVQAMTAGEAEKLLSAKGYLKSRHQALIGAKIPGRVERMNVEEGSKVKKGDVLAVLEHNELKALLASRRAMLRRNEAEMLEARADLKEKEREARPTSRRPRRTSATCTSTPRSTARSSRSRGRKGR